MGKTERVVKSSYDTGVNFHGGLIVLIIGLLFALYFWLGGYHLSVVCSGSMNPLLLVNDLVIIRESDDINVGDVVVYEKDGDEIIHRVINMDGDILTTKGDANTVADDPIEISAVKGKLVTLIPAVGGAVRTIRVPIDAVLAKMRAGDEASDTASVAAWVVNVEKTSDSKTDFNLTSAGSIAYKFIVKNYTESDGSATVCDVAMTYQISVVLPETDGSVTLTANLQKDGKDLYKDDKIISTGQNCTLSNRTCTFTDDSFKFDAATAGEHTYTLELKGGEDQVKSKTVLNDIQINVEAVQAD
jgi:signal peptidase